MNSRRVHLVFAALCLVAAVLAGYYAWRWQQAAQLNAAIAAAGKGDAALDASATPESVLAHALALSRQGSAEAAIKTYKALIQGERDDIKQAALYDLGNLYLRQALQDGAGEAPRYMPLIELSKQSYRSLLRLNSDAWDARYNLEQALRLAPEYDEVALDNAESLVPKERAITTMQGQKLDLP
jgi:mxaK protein